MNNKVKRRKKLIEVAIPLDIINEASAREKSIRVGHPSTFHLWWARRPLATARAVIFCQLVDDPSSVPEEFPTEELQIKERQRLFLLINELINWKNTTNEIVINNAKKEIRQSWERCCLDNKEHPKSSEIFNPQNIPEFDDPFAGGGGLPLEAMRLGLNINASDLNPVAVLINKALLDIPQKFTNQQPISPEREIRNQIMPKTWGGTEGLCEDIQYYSKWIEKKAKERIGHLYPKIKITNEIAYERNDLKKYKGQDLEVIAWLWARTIKSSNPAFTNEDVPLVSTFMLSTAAGKESYIEPLIENNKYKFIVKMGRPLNYTEVNRGTKLSRGANFKCLLSGSPIESSHIYSQAKAGRMGMRLMAVVVKGVKERLYLSPNDEIELVASQAKPVWKPELLIANNPRSFSPPLYGFKTFGELFTNRQLVALTTFSDLIKEAIEDAKTNSLPSDFPDDKRSLSEGGNGLNAYAEALGTYLSLGVGRASNRLATLCIWNRVRLSVEQVFSRQAIAMTWDFAEVNVFSSSTGGWSGTMEYLIAALKTLPKIGKGTVCQFDAAQKVFNKKRIISTDPPYYDNIPYADLSDFFYVWFRRSLRNIFPDLLATLAVPKAEELVAIPYRHGGRENADKFFLDGMSKVMQNISNQCHKSYPVTIYYAFKQSEKKSNDGYASTGWETFLEAVINGGFLIKGTWPIRTERDFGVKTGKNVLASSIILVCEQRSKNAEILPRNEFRRKLRQELPRAIKKLEQSNIAPVDIAQSIIGPGMEIFSSAKSVINPDDSVMKVRDALIDINIIHDEYLSEEEESYDSDTLFALTFFESFGFSVRPFGDAEGLAKARNVSVEGIVKAGILSAVSGKVHLIKREKLLEEWDPESDSRLCIWEATQHLIKRLESEGEQSASQLLSKLKDINGKGDLTNKCRSLVYRLYNHCEKTKQSQEALAYNGLIISWPELERYAAEMKIETTIQTKLI